MKTAAIIAARMGSTRFPGKVLADLNGKPVLQHVIERCKASNVDEVIVAIACSEADKVLGHWLVEQPVGRYVRHDENDVLSRVLGAAEANDVDVVLRVNSDCPLVEPERINELLEYHQAGSGLLDYVGFLLGDELPAVQTHVGLPELVTTDALRGLQGYADDIKEHVTLGCYAVWEVASEWIHLDESRQDEENTIDTPEDLERIACRLKSTAVQ